MVLKYSSSLIQALRMQAYRYFVDSDTVGACNKILYAFFFSLIFVVTIYRAGRYSHKAPYVPFLLLSSKRFVKILKGFKISSTCINVCQSSEVKTSCSNNFSDTKISDTIQFPAAVTVRRNGYSGYFALHFGIPGTSTSSTGSSQFHCVENPCMTATSMPWPSRKANIGRILNRSTSESKVLCYTLFVGAGLFSCSHLERREVLQGARLILFRMLTSAP